MLGLTNLDTGMILVTMDVSSLYTEIPTQMGIQVVREAFQSDIEYNKDEIDFICELLSIVLCNNYFMFGSQFYMQVTGTAMGSKVAPTFAVIFMNWFKEHFVYNHAQYLSQVKTWFRYIDDVFLLWQGNTDSLDIFHKYLNNCLPSISFSLEQDRFHLAFLDVQLQVHNGALTFDLHRKPTDKNSLLHYQSCHPP